MAIVGNRVKETTSTTGTGTYSLQGAALGHVAFADVLDGQVAYYCCEDGTDWELGYGLVTGGPMPTLTRGAILKSTNADAPVNWPAGTRDIFCTVPASKLLIKDTTNKVGTIADILHFLAPAAGFLVSETGLAASQRILHDGRLQATYAAKGELTLGQLKIKWGTINVTGDSTLADNFLTAFTTIYGCLVSAAGTLDTSNTGALTAAASTTQIFISNGISGAARACFYVAFGV